MLQLGWKAGTEQYGPKELLDFAIAAEAAGFDSIDASDHSIPGLRKARRRSSGASLERSRRERAASPSERV